MLDLRSVGPNGPLLPDNRDPFGTGRILLGLTQEQLAEGRDITVQQVQKYERGSNRVSASRLYHIARLLDVPVAWFFEGLDGSGEKQPLSIGTGLPDKVTSRKESLKLLR